MLVQGMIVDVNTHGICHGGLQWRDWLWLIPFPVDAVEAKYVSSYSSLKDGDGFMEPLT
jgi:hypothetical protein